MKLVEGKTYICSLYEKEFPVVYAGKFETCDYYCDHCNKKLIDGHEFIVGNIDNPKGVYHIGNTCVKKCIRLLK